MLFFFYQSSLKVKNNMNKRSSIGSAASHISAFSSYLLFYSSPSCFFRGLLLDLGVEVSEWWLERDLSGWKFGQEKNVIFYWMGSFPQGDVSIQPPFHIAAESIAMLQRISRWKQVPTYVPEAAWVCKVRKSYVKPDLDASNGRLTKSR